MDSGSDLRALQEGLRDAVEYTSLAILCAITWMGVFTLSSAKILR